METFDVRVREALKQKGVFPGKLVSIQNKLKRGGHAGASHRGRRCLRRREGKNDTKRAGIL